MGDTIAEVYVKNMFDTVKQVQNSFGFILPNQFGDNKHAGVFIHNHLFHWVGFGLKIEKISQ